MNDARRTDKTPTPQDVLRAVQAYGFSLHPAGGRVVVLVQLSGSSVNADGGEERHGVG
jgi:hypothetical protein